MIDWTVIGFSIGHSSIVRAYRESRKTFERELVVARSQMDAHLSEANGRLGEEDDDRAYEEFIVEAAWDAEQSLKTLREAFVLVIYHFWENEVRKIVQPTERFPRWIDIARERPDFNLDERLDHVRRIVNCIKHGSDESFYESAKELFDPILIEAGNGNPDYRVALRLRDQDVEDAFDAVNGSGPKATDEQSAIQEVYFREKSETKS